MTVRRPSSSRPEGLKYDHHDVQWSSRVQVEVPSSRPDTPIKSLSEQGYEPDDFRLTDSGNAKLFARIYAEQARFDHRRKRWLLWRGHHWARDEVDAVIQLAKDSAEVRYVWAQSIDDLKRRTATATWAIKSESRHRIEAALRLAQAEQDIANDGRGWDPDPYLLGVRNGVVNLRTGRLRGGRPEDQVTMQASVAFDSDALCPRWEQFLREVFDSDDELIDFVSRALGYSLTGDTSEQCLFFCYGSGGNGKTRLLNAIRFTLGSYAADTPFATFEMSGRSAIPNDVAALVGKRLVTASESCETARLNEARLKALAGEDPLTARFLHGEYFTFQPSAKLWLSSNHKPLVRDTSSGFWRRVRLIPFLRSFKGSAEDRTLGASLGAESSGILAWAVRGCREWQKLGLKPSTAVVDATEDYRAESDPLTDFLADRCILDASASAGATELFQAYQSWADARRIREWDRLGRGQLGRLLSERFQRKRKSAGICYGGIGLRM